MKIILLSLLFIVQIFGQYPDASGIMQKIDQNMSANNQIVVSTMVIHGRRGSRSITSKSWIQGTEKSFTEYLAPPREKGTKMLKIDNQLWIYSPQSDRIIRISGHMLRQSLMGSDLSYEDMMDDRQLVDIYSAKIVGEEQINNRDCWIMELTAKADNLAYYTQKYWVDKEYMIPLKEHLFAKSGKLLKTIELSELFQIENRWYPKQMLFQDVLLKGKGTEFIIESIKFDQDIPEYIFTKAALRK
ncbi:MAG: outer membrane lipoprotein-sorting protein [Planctomycetia bacterium]|nr:outer membrane lipoprotein-sorting protein [Planctomycetia bacterium]